MGKSGSSLMFHFPTERRCAKIRCSSAYRGAVSLLRELEQTAPLIKASRAGGKQSGRGSEWKSTEYWVRVEKSARVPLTRRSWQRDLNSACTNKEASE